MIEGFKKQTHDLTKYELEELVPVIVRGIEFRIGEGRSVTSKQAIYGMKKRGFKIDGPRFRKCINYIRINGLVPLLLATSKGYFVANSESSVERFIESLDQRINAITTVRDSLHYQLKNKLNGN